MLKGFSSVCVGLLGLALLAVVPLIARFLAKDIANDVRAAHLLLHALGAHPDVRAGREPGCGIVLRAQQAQATLHTEDFIAEVRRALQRGEARG